MNSEFRVPTLPIAKPVKKSSALQTKESIKEPFLAPEPPKPKVAAEESTEDESKDKDEQKPTEPPPPPPPVEKKIDKPKRKSSKESLPCPYRPPDWSGPTPPSDASSKYFVEVLKNGSIVETHDLVDKPFFTIGRWTECDMMQEHPSLSRYHAIIQYRGEKATEDDSDKSDASVPGFYLYDLGSTHGTFHNRHKCFPKKYYRLRVGHQLKFGMSTRVFIIQGPDEDMENVSEETARELMEKARRKAAEIKIQKEKEKEKMEEEKQKEKDRGIGWGFAEDATEDENENENPDMQKNPFAQATGNSEPLNLDDPKKSLRGWFEREGHDQPEYHCEEKGYATFECRLELPLDNVPAGVSRSVSATVKGKKKEAVAACALEACRVLDRLGLLRQANSEGASKIKTRLKKLEEDDFYDSDEDEFLDRTGGIQEKRKLRMKLAEAEAEREKCSENAEESPKKIINSAKNVETYETLNEKLSKLELEITESQVKYDQMVELSRKKKDGSEEEDLDSYMKNLKQGEIAAGNVDKGVISQLKQNLNQMKKDKERLRKLIELTRPNQLPKLKSEEEKKDGAKARFAGVMIGKRFGGIGKLRTVQKPTENRTKEAEIVKKIDTSLVDKFFAEENEKEAKKKLTKLCDDDEDEKVVDSEEKIQGESIENRENENSDKSSENTKEEDTSKNVDCENNPSENTSKNEDVTPPPTKKKKKNKPKPIPKTKEQEVEEEDQAVMGTEYKPSGSEDADLYATWTPPVNQTGDGRTALNDKLGY